MERRLGENRAMDFEGLKDGTYHFVIPGAYADAALVRLVLWGKRRRFRTACLDLIQTSWQIKQAECKTFGDQWRSAIRAVAPGLNWTGHNIRIPGGRAQITFSIPKGHDGEWLYRAAQFVSNTENLERLEPFEGYAEAIKRLGAESTSVSPF